MLLLGIILLTSCKTKEPEKTPSSDFYVISENGNDVTVQKLNIEEKKNMDFVIEDESINQWYLDTSERRQMIREFRNEFEQKKGDFEAEKRSEFKNVRAIIDSEMIIGYEEAPDLDKTFEESLAEPDVKSDSIYAIQS